MCRASIEQATVQYMAHSVNISHRLIHTLTDRERDEADTPQYLLSFDHLRSKTWCTKTIQAKKKQKVGKIKVRQILKNTTAGDTFSRTDEKVIYSKENQIFKMVFVK